MTVSMPGLTLERKLWAEGAGPVAGLDEAGRRAIWRRLRTEAAAAPTRS